MKKLKSSHLIISIFLFLLLIVSALSIYFVNRRTSQISTESTYASSDIKAFPTAMGYGANTKGGRAGKVIHVTNLNSSGEGSFANAVTASGPRTVVFDVGGVIDISSVLEVNDPYLTIAGQSAPPPGITIKGAGMKLKADEIIIRNIAIRPGDHHQFEGDSLQLSENINNVIIDHVSLNFATDETFSIHNSSANNVSLQNSIIAFPLNCSVHDKGCHGYNFLIAGDSKNVSLINNLSGFGSDRHPRIGNSSEIEIIENYFYKTALKCQASEEPRINLVNNIYEKPRFCNNICDWEAGKIYASGNTCNGTALDNVSDQYRSATPTFTLSNGIGLTGNNLKAHLFLNAGKIKPVRDGIDKEIITRFQSSSETLIDTPSELNGGYSLLDPGPVKTKVQDNDQDGMSDQFEKLWKLNPNDPSDSSKNAFNGYTNLENYLNGLAGDPVPNPPTSCEPNCNGKNCGKDGCGGYCGFCTTGKICSDGTCICIPDCTGKVCGDDGCGGSCGNCDQNLQCRNYKCLEECTPNCAGKECGDDGCGGICGKCDDGFECDDNKCINECLPNCTDKQCGDNGCGGSCGSCGTDQSCLNFNCVAQKDCTPNCDGKSCGNDGCGGSCGTCANDENCEDNQCIVECTPSCNDKECGNDGCGGSCGTCLGVEVCSNNFCSLVCTPNCSGRECGDDGCGGSCGSCNITENCDDYICTTQCVPNCSGIQCGSDGCGGSCGSCVTGYSCINQLCILQSSTDQNTQTSTNFEEPIQSSPSQKYSVNNVKYEYTSGKSELPETGNESKITLGILIVTLALSLNFIPSIVGSVKSSKRNKMNKNI